MPTDKQIAARRANALRSNGPITEEGKAAVSLNALKFGFYARDPVVPGEQREEWIAFRDELVASFEPASPTEKLLANRVADSAWRLRRLPVVEAAMFSYQMRQDESLICGSGARADAADEAADHADYTMGRVFIRDCGGDHAFINLARCESVIDGLMFRSLKQLEALQDRRNKRVTKISAGREKGKLQNSLTEDLTPVQTAA